MIKTDIDSREMESKVHKGDQATKLTPPPLPTKTDRDSRAEVSRVGGVQGGRTQTDRLTGAAQDSVLEEAPMLVKDRKGLIAVAEVGRLRNKKIDWGMGKK